MVFTSFNQENIGTITTLISKGGVGVVPTDTLYGLSCSALNKSSVEKIYSLKERDFDKPFIVLISALKDLDLFDVKIEQKTTNFLTKVWPGKLSIVFPVESDKFSYLHRGKKSLAFRIPKYPPLVDLISLSGPIVSTTVNKSGQEPALTIPEAQKLFGDKLDLYIDVGLLQNPSTTLIEIKNNQIITLRQGEVVVHQQMLE